MHSPTTKRLNRLGVILATAAKVYNLHAFLCLAHLKIHKSSVSVVEARILSDVYLRF